MSRKVAGILCLLAGSAVAQQPAFYPALDLPLGVPTDWKLYNTTIVTHLPLADARHFTPSPHTWVRDLDGDGHLDATWLFEGLWVFRGHGDGRFDGSYAPAQLEPTWKVRGQWGDVTGEGLPDAVFLGTDSTQVFVDQGGGDFATSGILDVAGSNDLSFDDFKVCDLTGDGLGDIATANVNSIPGHHLAALVGQGDGTFVPPVALGFPGQFLQGLGVGDADGNGEIDLAVSTSSDGTGRLRIWTHAGGLSFVSHPFVTTTAWAMDLELRDMTGDGHVDVISREGTTTVIYPGDGQGGLSAPLGLPDVGTSAVFVDLNEDGLVDVIADRPVFDLETQVLFAQPDGSLKAPVTTRHRADVLDTGDFDEDGVLDLFSPQAALRGCADGRFVAPRAFDLGALPELPTQALFADFNEDGASDLLVIDYPLPDAFVNLSQPGATWRPPTLLPSTNKLKAAAAGDLDGDGHADVVASHWLGATADTWLGNGQGGFAPGPVVNMSGVFGNTGIGIGRFDAAAPADLVATGDGQLVVRRGMGGLQFAAAQVTPLPGAEVWFVVRDLDGDELDDLVVVTPQIQVHRCIGHGHFAPPQALGGAATALAVDDVDGDGQPDVLAANDKVVTAYLQDDNFAPAPFAPVTSERAVLGLALADVDGDALLDLALGHQHAWSLHLGVLGGGWAAEPVDVFDLTGSGLALRFEDGNADGRPDLLTAGAGVGVLVASTTELGLAFAVHQLGPWSDAGFALPSPNGEPFLWPAGTLQPDSPIELVVRDTKPLAPVVLIVGLAQALAPFKGGTLVPAPLLVLGLGSTGTDGALALASIWPAGVPSGAQLWLQAWIQDAAGVAGFAATNGVSGTTP